MNLLRCYLWLLRSFTIEKMERDDEKSGKILFKNNPYNDDLRSLLWNEMLRNQYRTLNLYLAHDDVDTTKIYPFIAYNGNLFIGIRYLESDYICNLTTNDKELDKKMGDIIMKIIEKDASVEEILQIAKYGYIPVSKLDKEYIESDFEGEKHKGIYDSPYIAYDRERNIIIAGLLDKDGKPLNQIDWINGDENIFKEISEKLL